MRRRLRHRPSPGALALRGFTLLEMIIVILVFGIMAVMAYGGLNAVLRARDVLKGTLDRTTEMQKAYLRLRGDFQNLRNRPIRGGFGDVEPALYVTRDGFVELTRGGWRNPLYLPRSSMERVAYAYDEKQKALLRSSWRVLDRVEDSAPTSTTLLSRVDEVAWRFLDHSRQWQDQWPPASTSRSDAGEEAPPMAVELTLKTPDWGELRFVFRPGADPVDQSTLNALQNNAPGGAGEEQQTGGSGGADGDDGGNGDGAPQNGSDDS